MLSKKEQEKEHKRDQASRCEIRQTKNCSEYSEEILGGLHETLIFQWEEADRVSLD